MDHREPQVSTNSANLTSEASAARRIFNAVGEFVREHRSKAVAALAVGALGLSLSACGTNARAEGPAPSTTQSAEATPTPTDTQTPDTQETTAPNTGEFTAPILEQTQTYEAMKAMSVEEYAQLGIADHIAFAADTFEGAFPLANAGDNSLTDENAPSIPGYFWQQANGYAYNNADPTIRAKLAASYAYYVTDKLDGAISKSYQAAIDDVTEHGGAGVGGALVMNYVANGEPQHGLDRDGNPIDFMNITYKSGIHDTVDTAPEKTSQAIRVEIKLLDGSDKVFYALGYTTDGHESPDTGYPY